MTNDCWIWEGALSEGYGIVSTGAKQRDRVHRLVYEAIVGPIPDGLHIDHLCRNRKCYNPAHLEPVTPAENNRRARVAAGHPQTHCKRGHEWTDENTYWHKRGYRVCRRCKREKDAETARSGPPCLVCGSPCYRYRKTCSHTCALKIRWGPDGDYRARRSA